MEFDQFGDPIPPQQMQQPGTIGDFFGVGPQAQQMQQQGLSDPRAAAWAQALSNISQMNMGGIPQTTPFSAAFDVRRQNALLMDRKYSLIQQREEAALMRQMREMQMAEIQRKAKIEAAQEPNPYANLPEKAQLWKMSGSKLSLDDWLTKTGAAQQSMPADVQSYLFGQSLPPGKREEFQGGRFAPIPVKIGDVTYLVNRGTGGGTAIGPEGMTNFDDINAVVREAAGEKAAAVAQGTVEGKAAGEKAAGAPAARLAGEYALTVIDKAISHPGREAATGFSSIGNIGGGIPGTDRADFLVLTDQLKGQAFIQAYQSLKGGGTITEIEGTKATEAQNRLNEAQSEGEYLQALYDARDLLRSAASLIPDTDAGDEDINIDDAPPPVGAQ